jgi:hypothetical protein
LLIQTLAIGRQGKQSQQHNLQEQMLLLLLLNQNKRQDLHWLTLENKLGVNDVI